MSATPNDVIVFSLKASQKRFHSYVDDLKPAEFEAQPIPGVNSVAWMLGHLALTDRRIIGLLGGQVPELPAGFEDKFKTTKQAAGEQKGLGDPKELLAIFDAQRTKLIETVEAADAATLNKPMPNPHPLFGTVGEAAAFMAIHYGLHAGQVTVIRRALGYPPLA
jgi:uncharacterized damage-inducible protein DinB